MRMILAARECEARSDAWVLWMWRDEAGGVLCTPDWLFSGDVKIMSNIKIMSMERY